MQLASATNRNGNLMARTTPAGQSWKAWLLPHMAAMGLTKQTELIAALEAAGCSVARQSVSKWFSASNAAEPNVAVVVADVLNTGRAGALRAIGLDVVADGMEKEEAARGAQAADADPNIQWIQNLTNRSPERKARMIKRYLARVALIREDIELAEAEAQDVGEDAD